jgi:chemotaxis protein histidine kinase CheA
MNDRRKALQRKFQAVAADRIRGLSLALIELAEGRAGAAAVHEVARELHTLKGESNMLGFPRVALAAHAAETLLVARAGEAAPDRATCERLQRAFDRMDDAIQGRLSEEEASLDALLLELAAPAGAAPDAPPPSKEEPSRAPARVAERWVQVDAARVDALCENVTDFGAEFRALAARFDALLGPLEAHRAVAFAARLLGEELDRCRARLDDVTDAAWTLRLAPIEPTLEDLVRHAQKIAARQGKRVRTSVAAGGASVERGLLDELWEPLLHLVQNAIDHGLEQPADRGDKPPEASLRLHAEAVGPSVVLTVTDDGRGIDPAAVRAVAERRGLVTRDARMTEREVLDLIFVHGFSTRDEVTEVSGRGVGLDVVRRRVESFGGAVTVSTELGRGSRFVLTLPATVSRERALVIDLGGALYGVPCRGIVELVRVADHAVEAAPGGASALRIRDERVPLRSLASTLRVALAEPEPWAMILGSSTSERRAAFTIPRAVGEHDLLRRPLDPLLARLDYLSASSTLDDGRLVLILVVAGVMRRGDLATPQPR